MSGVKLDSKYIKYSCHGAGELCKGEVDRAKNDMEDKVIIDLERLFQQ